MSDDIKELVNGLRARAELAAAEGNMTATCDARYFTRAADALEALADEVERLRNEKVAGGHAESVPEEVESFSQTPATDPAPVVCEWTRAPWARAPFDALYTPRCDADYLCKVPDSGICRRCGRPIKFTEAKDE